MTDHRATLSAFLRTDLYRIEAAIGDADWNAAIATRLTEHCQRLAAVVGLMTDVRPDVLLLTATDSAIGTLHDLTDELLGAIASASDARLDATVLDRHHRQMTVLAHLYDYARLSAMLVEWTTTLTPADTLDSWFDALDDTP